MDIGEIQEHLKSIADQITHITSRRTGADTEMHWRSLSRRLASFKANEDAPIYEHLWTAFSELLKPAVFRKFKDQQGHRFTYQFENWELIVTVAHRGLRIEDIDGVDLIYEIAGYKTIAFQHKRRAPDGHLIISKKDRNQRDKIVRLCAACPEIQKRSESESFVIMGCSALNVASGATDANRDAASAGPLGPAPLTRIGLNQHPIRNINLLHLSYSTRGRLMASFYFATSVAFCTGAPTI